MMARLSKLRISQLLVMKIKTKMLHPFMSPRKRKERTERR